MDLVYCGFLFIAALLFTAQFLLTNVYQKKFGVGLTKTLSLSALAFFVAAIFFFSKGCIVNNEIHFSFSWFTFLIALGVAIVNVTVTFIGVKTLKIGSMAMYSMFMMIGSIVLPSLVGIIVYNEKVNAVKIIAIILMVVAIVFSSLEIKKESTNKKAFILYVICLILNGLIGVFFTIHQNNAKLTAGVTSSNGSLKVDNDLYMFWFSVSTVLISLIGLAIIKIFKIKDDFSKSDKKFDKRMFLLFILIPIGYGLCNGLGNYFIAIATQPNALGSSVTYPLVDGGTILFSTIVSVLIYKEKFAWNKIVSVVIVISSCCMLMFA